MLFLPAATINGPSSKTAFDLGKTKSCGGSDCCEFFGPWNGKPERLLSTQARNFVSHLLTVDRHSRQASQSLVLYTFVLSSKGQQARGFILCSKWGSAGVHLFLGVVCVGEAKPCFPRRKLLMAATLKLCCSDMTSLLLRCRSDYSLAKYWHGLFYLMLVSRPKSPSIYRLLTHWC